MNDDIPQAIWSGTFNIFGVEVKCHTLNNGMRIIEADSLHELMMSAADGFLGDSTDQQNADALNKFIAWRNGAFQ